MGSISKLVGRWSFGSLPNEFEIKLRIYLQFVRSIFEFQTKSKSTDSDLDWQTANRSLNDKIQCDVNRLKEAANVFRFGIQHSNIKESCKWRNFEKRFNIISKLSTMQHVNLNPIKLRWNSRWWMCSVRRADFVLHNDIEFIIYIFIYDEVCRSKISSV